MNTLHSDNGPNGKRPQGAGDALPLPKALLATVKRDAEGALALLWALVRLTSRKRKPSFCYPGSGACPFCHPDTNT